MAAGRGLGGQVGQREERQQDAAEEKAGPGVVTARQLLPAQRPVERAENTHVPNAQRDDGQTGGNSVMVRILPEPENAVDADIGTFRCPRFIGGRYRVPALQPECSAVRGGMLWLRRKRLSGS